MIMKRLYKSKENKILAGVIGGLGKYFNIDPVILRVVWIIVTALTGFFPGIVAYFVASLIIPEKRK
jgi:phage shock protein C